MSAASPKSIQNVKRGLMTFFDFMDKHFDAIANGFPFIMSVICFTVFIYLTFKNTYYS